MDVVELKRRLVKITGVVPVKGGEKYLNGTGYFVTSDLILTANHVLSEGDPLETTIFIFTEDEPDRWKEANIQLVWRDTEKDAVLLRVSTPLDGIGPVSFLESPPEKNERWDSVGYPDAATQPGAGGT